MPARGPTRPAPTGAYEKARSDTHHSGDDRTKVDPTGPRPRAHLLSTSGIRDTAVQRSSSRGDQGERSKTDRPRVGSNMPMHGRRPVETAYDPQAEGALCGSCPLQGARVVPPTPALNRVRLIIVGEAPGRIEAATGKCFVGPSGLLLNKILDELSFSRDNAHVTNAILCRPDEEKQIKEAMICCAPRLANELSRIDKRVPVSALGAVASRMLLGQKTIFKARGFVWEIPKPKEPKKKRSKTNGNVE